jgi:pilus assembly protein CpaB
MLLGLALVLGGLAASDVARREAAVAAQLGPLVDVVVARHELPAGRRVAADDLGLRRVPGRFVPAGAARGPGEVVGRRLAVPVPTGGYLAAEQLAVPTPAPGAMLGRGERATDLVALGAPSLVVPGSRVDVLVTRERDGDVAGGAQLALEDVEVLAARPAPEAPGGGGVPRVAVTLRVSVRQAVYLAAAQSFAREVRLLPRAPGDRRRTGGLAVDEELR